MSSNKRRTKKRKIYTHGHARKGKCSSTYRSWCAMKSRCLNKTRTNYHFYGRRGIGICKSWHKFENFLADMGERPNGKTLDRIDNNLGYSPQNCRWATHIEQCNNRRDNLRFTLNGKSKTISQWARESGHLDGQIRSRINKGWSIKDAITIPGRVRGSGLILFKGEIKTITQWAREYDRSPNLVWDRVRKAGWPIEKALTLSPRKQKSIKIALR